MRVSSASSFSAGCAGAAARSRARIATIPTDYSTGSGLSGGAEAGEEGGPAALQHRGAAAQVDPGAELADDRERVPENFPAGDDAVDRHAPRQCAARASANPGPDTHKRWISAAIAAP